MGDARTTRRALIGAIGGMAVLAGCAGEVDDGADDEFDPPADEEVSERDAARYVEE